MHNLPILYKCMLAHSDDMWVTAFPHGRFGQAIQCSHQALVDNWLGLILSDGGLSILPCKLLKLMTLLPTQSAKACTGLNKVYQVCLPDVQLMLCSWPMGAQGVHVCTPGTPSKPAPTPPSAGLTLSETT